MGTEQGEGKGEETGEGERRGKERGGEKIGEMRERREEKGEGPERLPCTSVAGFVLGERLGCRRTWQGLAPRAVVTSR